MEVLGGASSGSHTWTSRDRSGTGTGIYNNLGRAVKCSRLPSSEASHWQRTNNITGLCDWAADLEEGDRLPRALQALLLRLITSDYKGQCLREKELSGWISCIPAMFKIPVMLSCHQGQRLKGLVFNMAGAETIFSRFVFVLWDAQELMISHLFPAVFPLFGSCSSFSCKVYINAYIQFWSTPSDMKASNIKRLKWMGWIHVSFKYYRL